MHVSVLLVQSLFPPCGLADNFLNLYFFTPSSDITIYYISVIRNDGSQHSISVKWWSKVVAGGVYDIAEKYSSLGYNAPKIPIVNYLANDGCM